MGHTVQLQWAYTPPAGRQVTLGDIVLPRVLEHYGLHTPTRSTIQFRTYRAQFPTAAEPSNSTDIGETGTGTGTHSRYLTSITTLPSLPGGVSAAASAQAKLDDTAYLFLDDRSPPRTSNEPRHEVGNDQPKSELKSGLSDGANGETRKDGTAGGADGAQPMSVDGPAKPIDVTEDNGTSLDEDGFEIIDIPKSSDSSAPATGTGTAPVLPQGAPTDLQAPVGAPEAQPLSDRLTSDSAQHDARAGTAERKHERFRCLAVRPGTNLGPMLQNLLSPFVMGLTKSARATASTTSSLPTPTPLPGTTLLLTQLTFAPHPLSSSASTPPLYTRSGSGTGPSAPGGAGSVVLRIYILPNPSAGSIFLEAEHVSSASATASASASASTFVPPPQNDGVQVANEDVDATLRAFLDGCLVDGVQGEKKWVDPGLPEGGLGETGRQPEGLDRNKRSMFALAKTLREGGFI